MYVISTVNSLVKNKLTLLLIYLHIYLHLLTYFYLLHIYLLIYLFTYLVTYVQQSLLRPTYLIYQKRKTIVKHPNDQNGSQTLIKR